MDFTSLALLAQKGGGNAAWVVLAAVLFGIFAVIVALIVLMYGGIWFQCYMSNANVTIWSLIGIIPCIWLGALKTRDFSKKLGAATLPETIGRRFESKGLQTVVAVSMLFFLFLYSNLLTNLLIHHLPLYLNFLLAHQLQLLMDPKSKL